MQIEFLQVTIKPWERDSQGYLPKTMTKELKIEVQVNGQKYYASNFLLENDFTSNFDLIVDEAKSTIRKFIKKYLDEGA